MGVESEIETIQSSSDEDEEISYPKVLGILFFFGFFECGVGILLNMHVLDS